jgi:XTP/dITP diphosphohydrolase
MDLIFASHNENKVKEIRAILPKWVNILSLNDIGFHEEIEETGTTLEENAQIKAETIYNQIGKNVFADDSGLFVDALEGAPGVFSARYAGTGNSEDNIAKLLNELKGESNRKAEFRATFCVIWNGQIHFLKGKVEGNILEDSKGSDGFGYDPIFVPNGYSQTFAEMVSTEKNSISHRHEAVQKLINFIENQAS